MAETFETIKTRRSIRKYKADPVPPELLDKVLEAGTWAATGMGKQSPIILAVTNKEKRDELSRMNAQVMGADIDPFYGAPVVLVVLADKSVPTCVYDGAIVLDNMMLEAHDLGLGSCYIFRAKEEFETEEGKKFLADLGIDPDAYEGIGHVIIGYADGEDPEPKPRKANYVYRVD